MAKQQDGYLSAKESRRISKENRRITDQYEKQRKRKTRKTLLSLITCTPISLPIPAW